MGYKGVWTVAIGGRCRSAAVEFYRCMILIPVLTMVDVISIINQVVSIIAHKWMCPVEAVQIVALDIHFELVGVCSRLEV